MQKFKTGKLLLSILSAALCAGPPAWANVVQNGGFETGDFTGWTVNPNANNTWRVETAGFDSLSPYAGTYFASDGCVGAPCVDPNSFYQSSLSQTIATSASQSYDLSFEFYTGGNSTANELTVLWNGATVLDLGPGGTLGPINSYTLYTVSGLAASSSSSVLTFLGRQDPGWDALDNVDLEPSTSTPEPSFFALIGAMLAVIAIRQFGKRRLVS